MKYSASQHPISILFHSNAQKYLSLLTQPEHSQESINPSNFYLSGVVSNNTRHNHIFCIFLIITKLSHLSLPFTCLLSHTVEAISIMYVESERLVVSLTTCLQGY